MLFSEKKSLPVYYSGLDAFDTSDSSTVVEPAGTGVVADPADPAETVAAVLQPDCWRLPASTSCLLA